MTSGTIIKTDSPSLLDAALALQEGKGWVSGSDVVNLANQRGLSASEVYDALSFYSMIHLKKPATVKIEVCRGTSCYTAHGTNILKELERIIGCGVGSTSPDGQYHLDYVECIGHCETAPNLLINGKLYPSVTPESIQTILKEAAL